MRKIIESKKATVVTHVLTGAGGLTVLVAVLAAGLKWTLIPESRAPRAPGIRLVSRRRAPR